MRRRDRYDWLYTEQSVPQPEPYGWWWGPGSVMPDAPMYGWGWWGGGWGWPPQTSRYAAEYMPRRRHPSQSPTYGRYADDYARRWAQRYGYDVEMSIGPSERGYARRQGYHGGGYDAGQRSSYRDRQTHRGGWWW